MAELDLTKLDPCFVIAVQEVRSEILLAVFPCCGGWLSNYR
jgi:hypothetical protein